MKKLILLLLFVPLVGFGQNISFLDQKNGFKEIKLGTNINDYDYVYKVIKSKTKFEFKFDAPFNLGRSVERSYFGSNYEYYVDESLEEFMYYPGGWGKIRVYIGTFNDLISDITIIMKSHRGTVYPITRLREVFGIGDRNLLYYTKEPNKKYWHIWNGKKIKLELQSIHYIPDGTGLKYQRIIGWRVRYVLKDLYLKKITEEQRIEKLNKEKKTKELLNDF